MQVRVTVFAAFALMACEKAHGANDSHATPVTASEYQERVVEAMNEWDQRCCEQAGLTLPEPGHVPWPDVQAKFDEKAAAKCLAEIARMPCTPQKGDGDSYRPAVCQEVYTGTVALGEACSNPWECAPSAEPDSYVTCYGVTDVSSFCRHVSLRKEGESCAPELDDDVECVKPLLCDDKKRVCVARPKLGEPCMTGPTWGDTCAEGAVCDRTNTKRCIKPVAVGKPCQSINECENLACVDGTCREPLFVVPLCEAADE